MIFYLAEGDHCCAAFAWAKNLPPLALLLVLLNLVQWGPLGATLVTALMLDLLSNCQGKQALALTKRFPPPKPTTPADRADQLRGEYMSKISTKAIWDCMLSLNHQSNDGNGI